MDKNVHPVAAFFIVLISVGTIAFWLWATGEAKEYGGPAGLTVDPDGHLYIQVRNQLLEHDADGDFVARHDLADLDVAVMLGGTDFFANGDILLRRGPDTRSLMDTIRAFQRRTNQNSIVPDAPDTGLFRCRLDSKECRVFGQEPIDFKSTFSVYIDRETDDVYISDSSRHLIRKYSADGVALAEPASGFKFPNQLMLHEQQLLVADTNHHRIRTVTPDNDGFGTEIATDLVVPSLAVNNEQRWPSHFLRVGDEWWVNNMMTGMNFGGIYVFDDDWRFQRIIVLPDDADPIALVMFNDEVLISDWYGDRVHRVSPTGNVLGDFTSSGLSELQEESDAARSMYTLYAWVGAALGAFLVAMLVIKGTDWAQRSPPPADAPPPDPRDPVLLEPDPKNVEKLLSNARLAGLLMVPLGIAIPLFMYLVDETAMRVNLMIGGVGFIILYFVIDRMTKANIGTSIRIEPDVVTLRDGRGQEVRSPLSKVFYTDVIVFSGNVSVFLGQGQNAIYDKEHVLEVLAQRLPQSQRISVWAMQKKMMAAKHPTAFAAIGAIILLIIAVAFVYR